MAEPFVQAASRLAECCALLAIGYNLKQSGILRTSDGETAIKVATTLTLPSVIVQALGNGGPLGGGAVSLLGVAAVCMGAQLAATWLYVMHRPVRERSLLSGACTGLSLRLFGYPLAECFLGGPPSVAGAAAAAGAGAAGACGAAAALQAVALVDLVNHVAVWVGAYLLFAGAGPAFPESFAHEDGGDYRGQWRGMRKEGLGVYTYASGARYEGEWRNNVKEGRGVYYFPKGGVYEGEWSGGSMNGLGVRTLSSGQVKAGRWRDGQLETPLELWQVALAADGATAVAAAARSVEVGGGRLVDALHQLAAQPTLWALAVGLAMNLARVPLPTSVDLITGVLATANTPLMLLAAGITAPALALPKGLSPSLLLDTSRLLGSRLLVPLTVGLSLTALLAASGGGAGAGGGFDAGFRVAQSTLAPLAAALLALLAPVPPEALTNARRFRLNEATAAAISSLSYLVCVPLMLLAGVAAVAAGLATPPPPGIAAVAATADARPLGVFTLAAVVAVGAAVGYVARRSSQPEAAGAAAAQSPEDRRILMVYAGPPGTAQGSPSASPSASTPPSASASLDEGLGPASTSGTAGGPSTGGAGSRRSPPPSAAAAAATVPLGATASPPPRGAASCWGGRAGCGGRTAPTASRVVCAAAAIRVNEASAASSPRPLTATTASTSSWQHGACCRGGATRTGFGALTGPRSLLGRSQRPSVVAASSFTCGLTPSAGRFSAVTASGFGRRALGAPLVGLAPTAPAAPFPPALARRRLAMGGVVVQAGTGLAGCR